MYRNLTLYPSQYCFLHSVTIYTHNSCLWWQQACGQAVKNRLAYQLELCERVHGQRGVYANQGGRNNHYIWEMMWWQMSRVSVGLEHSAAFMQEHGKSQITGAWWALLEGYPGPKFLRTKQYSDRILQALENSLQLQDTVWDSLGNSWFSCAMRWTETQWSYMAGKQAYWTAPEVWSMFLLLSRGHRLSKFCCA